MRRKFNLITADNLTLRLTYGAGTRLITSYGDASLGGVYKLTAMEEKADGTLQ